MALSLVTVWFNLHQLLGADFDPRRTKAYVVSNVANQTLADLTTGEERLGDQRVDIATDGTGSWTTWVPDAGFSNPASWQETLVVDYPRTGSHDRKQRRFGPFTLSHLLVNVTNKALTSNVATLGLDASHGLRVGDTFTVADVDATFNGDHVVSAVPSPSQVSFALTHADIASTAATGQLGSAYRSMALLEEEQAVPAEYLTQVTDALDQIRDEAAVSAATATTKAGEAAASATLAQSAAATAAADTVAGLEPVNDTIMTAVAVDEDSDFAGVVVARTSRAKHAPALGVYYPEAEGAVGDWNGSTGTDDTAAVQAAFTAAGNAGGKAQVYCDSDYRITGNLYGFGPVDFVGPGSLVLDPVSGGAWITEQDNFKYWINLGVSAKGVDAAVWSGTWSVNVTTSATVQPTDVVGGVPTPTGMRLINAHRCDLAAFENFTIDLTASGASKVSGVGCYSDTAWAPTPTKKRLTARRVYVIAAQTGALGGEGLGFGGVDGLWVLDNYIYGVGDDVIGIHAQCSNYVVAGNKAWSRDGRIYCSSSQNGHVHHNRNERIADPGGTWNSGGALMMFEIENQNGGAPADTHVHDNTLVHGSGITSATYGIRLRGVRRFNVHHNRVHDTSGFGYAITWEDDPTGTTWVDPEGLEGAVQVVKTAGSPTGGTFTLTYAGQTTTAIAYDASTATMQTALEALSTIGTGNVTVSGAGAGTWTVTLGSAITSPVKMTFTSSLTGGTSPSMTIAVSARVRDLDVLDNRATGGGDGRITQIGAASDFVGPIKVHGNSPGSGGTTLSTPAAYAPTKFPAGAEITAGATFKPKSTSSVPNNTLVLDSADNKLKYRDNDGTLTRVVLDRSTVLTTTATVSNTTADTALWTDATIAATLLRVGMLLRITLHGNFDTILSGGAFNIKHKINGVTIVTSALATVSQSGAGTQRRWRADMDVFVEAVGSSGVVSILGSTITRSNAGGTIAPDEQQGLAVSVDLSSGLTYSAEAVMATADAGNVIRLFRASRFVAA